MTKKKGQVSPNRFLLSISVPEDVYLHSKENKSLNISKTFSEWYEKTFMLEITLQKAKERLKELEAMGGAE